MSVFKNILTCWLNFRIVLKCLKSDLIQTFPTKLCGTFGVFTYKEKRDAMSPFSLLVSYSENVKPSEQLHEPYNESCTIYLESPIVNIVPCLLNLFPDWGIHTYTYGEWTTSELVADIWQPFDECVPLLCRLLDEKGVFAETFTLIRVSHGLWMHTAWVLILAQDMGPRLTCIPGDHRVIWENTGILPRSDSVLGISLNIIVLSWSENGKTK